MPTSYQIAVVLHVLAAVVWAGGVLFIGFVAYPAARRLDEEARGAVMSEIGRRFRHIGWSALAVLVATGLWMASSWGMTLANTADLSFFAGPRNRVLGYKLLAVVTMIAVSGAHDWWIGPRATEVARAGSASAPKDGSDVDEEALGRWRLAAAVFGVLTALLVLLIVVLAVYVARPHMI